MKITVKPKKENVVSKGLSAAKGATAPTSVKLSAKKALVVPDDWVQIAMLRTIPAPRVGTFHVRKELKKTHLRVNKSYHVPLNVALHLKDAKSCVIVGHDDDDGGDDIAEGEE